MDGARSRIMALEFDHALFRTYPGGALVPANDLVSDKLRLHAAIERLDDLESRPVEPLEAQKETLAVMTRDACNNKRCNKRKPNGCPPYHIVDAPKSAVQQIGMP